MKLKQHKINRLNNDRMVIDAEWTDRMRRQSHVTVAIHTSPDPSSLPQGPLMDTTLGEGMDVLYSLAEMAWETGWRPRGLAGTMAAMVVNFSIPPESS